MKGPEEKAADGEGENGSKNWGGRKKGGEGYLVMQGSTDESQGSKCCRCKLKHLTVKEERFTWSEEDR